MSNREWPDSSGASDGSLGTPILTGSTIIIPLTGWYDIGLQGAGGNGGVGSAFNGAFSGAGSSGGGGGGGGGYSVMRRRINAGTYPCQIGVPTALPTLATTPQDATATGSAKTAATIFLGLYAQGGYNGAGGGAEEAPGGQGGRGNRLSGGNGGYGSNSGSGANIGNGGGACGGVAVKPVFPSGGIFINKGGYPSIEFLEVYGAGNYEEILNVRGLGALAGLGPFGGGGGGTSMFGLGGVGGAGSNAANGNAGLPPVAQNYGAGGAGGGGTSAATFLGGAPSAGIQGAIWVKFLGT